MWLGVVMENWTYSVDQCQLQALQFLVQFIHLLSILLRCNGFTGIQKAAVDQTSSRPPNNDHDLFLVQVGFRKCFEASQLAPKLVITGCHVKWHFSSNVTIQSRNGSLLLCKIREDNTSMQQCFLKLWVSLWGTHLSSLWTGACQAPLSTGFSRQEHWSRLPCPSPGYLLYPGIELASLLAPALASGFFTTNTAWKPLHLSSLLQTP